MWIAKPLEALTAQEKRQWVEACAKREARGEDVPLSQTLTWAQAMPALGVRPYLVFNPDEAAGGIVFSPNGASFECVNGPLLDWAWLDSAKPDRLTQQFATFAMGVTKLSRSFSSLELSPRWLARDTQRWLARLPVEPSSRSRAATIHIPVEASDEAQLRGFQPRLRRTLRHSLRESLVLDWRTFLPEECESFWTRLTAFSQTKGFPSPPLPWFRALLADSGLRDSERISFWLARALVSDDPETSFPTPEETAGAELLICFKGRQAHYLFGLEERGREVPASLSPSALAHWKTLEECRKNALRIYDLNGYVADAPPDHPYSGVCRFKEQFGGQVVEYDVPEFQIS